MDLETTSSILNRINAIQEKGATYSKRMSFVGGEIDRYAKDLIYISEVDTQTGKDFSKMVRLFSNLCSLFQQHTEASIDVCNNGADLSGALLDALKILESEIKIIPPETEP